MDFPEDVLSLNSLDELAMMADEVSADELVELIHRLGQGPLLNLLNTSPRSDGWPLGWCEALEDLISKASGAMDDALEALTSLAQPTMLAMISAMLRHELITAKHLDEALLPQLVERCIQQLGFHRDQPKPYFHWELDTIKQSWPAQHWRPLLIEAAATTDEELELEVWAWVEQELLPYANDAQRIHIATHHKAAPHSQALGCFDQARAIEVCRQAASPQALEACLSVASRCLGRSSSSLSALFVATVGLAHIADVLGRPCPRVDYALWEQLGKAMGSALTPHLDAIAHTLPQTHYPGARYQETLRYYDQLNAAAQCRSLYHPAQGELVEFELRGTTVQRHSWSAQRPNQTASHAHPLVTGVLAIDQERALKRELLEQGYIPIPQQALPKAALTTHLELNISALCLNPNDGTIWAYAPGQEPLLRFNPEGELLARLKLPLMPKAFSPDGTLLAGVLHNQGVIYDTVQGTLTVLEGSGGLDKLCWSADATMLAGIDRFGGLHTWRGSGDSVYVRLASRYGARPHSKIAFNPYAELLFFGGQGRALLLRVETLETIKRDEILPIDIGVWLNEQRGYLSASPHTMIAHYPLDRARRALAPYHHQHRLMLSPCVNDHGEHTFKLGHLLAQDRSGQLVMLQSSHQRHYNHYALALWDVERGQARGVWRVDDHCFREDHCCLALSLDRLFFADKKGLHSFALTQTSPHHVYELHQRELANELVARELAHTGGIEERSIDEIIEPRAPLGRAPLAIKEADDSKISPAAHAHRSFASALNSLKKMTTEQTATFFAQCMAQRHAYEAQLEQLLYHVLIDQIELALWFIERLPDKVLLPIFSTKKEIARDEPQFNEDHLAWDYGANQPKEPKLHTKAQLDQRLQRAGWGGLAGLTARLRRQLQRFKTNTPPPLVGNRPFNLYWMLNTEAYERYQGDYFKSLSLLTFATQLETFNPDEFLAQLDLQQREELWRDATAMSSLDVRIFCLTYEQVGQDAARATLLLQGIQEHRSNVRALRSFMDQHGFTQATAGPTLGQLGIEWPT